MVLGSKHFERYWAKFALSWGVQLYLKLIMLGTDLNMYKDKELGEDVAKRILALAGKLDALGEIPIITAEELAVPSE